MRRRIIGWVLWVAGGLALTTASGTCVKLSVDTSRPDYNTRFAPVGPGVVYGAKSADPKTPRNDLLTRGPTRFKAGVKPANAVESQQYADAIRQFAQAIEQDNPYLFDQAFDARRAAEEWGPLGAFRLITDKPTNGWLDTEAEAIKNSLVGPAAAKPPHLKFASVSIESIAPATVGAERLVIAKHTGSRDGVTHTWYTRWWLTPGERYGGWRVYDFDDPIGRTRLTVARATAASARPKNAAADPFGQATELGSTDVPKPEIETVRPAGRDAVARLRRTVDRYSQLDVIPATEAFRIGCEGMLATHAGRTAEADALFRRAKAVWDDAPVVDLFRAQSLVLQKKPVEALKALADYRARYGSGAVFAFAETTAHLANADTPAALVAARRGLDDTPGDPSLLAILFQMLPATNRREVGERAAASGGSAALVAVIDAVMADSGTPEQLADLVAGFRAIRPRDPQGMLEDAALKLARGKAADAGPLVKDALDRLTDPAARDAAVRRYVGRATAAGKAFDGYSQCAAVTPAAAVRAATHVLDEQAVDSKAARDALAAVAAAHVGKHPADPWGDYAAGVAAAHADDHAAAERAFAAGIGKLPNPAVERPGDPDPRAIDHVAADWEAFRGRRVAALVALGQWRRAYAEVPPAADTFTQLAALMRDAGDGDALVALAAERRRAVPDDAEAVAAAVSGHWLKKDYAAAAERADEYFKQAGFDTPGRQTVLDYQVRSLVRLGKAADARTAVSNGFPLEDPNAMLYNTMTEDDPELLAEDLRELLAKGWTAAALYADPDLGPKLRSPAFAAVRDRFPPPKE